MKKDLPLVIGMAMYEGDPAVVKAAHARQVHGTVTPFRVGP